MSNIIDSIRMSGTTYAISDSGGTKVVEITQSDYDNLPTSAKTANIMYVITDAEPFDVSNYYTKAETSGATELATAFAATQPKLSAGTNITIDENNVISAEGGGGKAVVGGRGITVTTGATADTVSFSLPISAGTGSNSVIEGDYANKATGSYSHAEGGTTSATTNYAHAEGMKTKAAGQSSHAEGERTTATTHYSHTEGYFTIANNKSEHASGQYNVSNKIDTTFGHSGNTLFSVGNGTDTTARHNAFEIRQNGDIYLTKDGQDIKLQDQLGGGGGSSYTAGNGIDITNDVISVTGMTAESAFTTHTADTTIHVTAQDKTNWNNKSDFSGNYNDLSNKPTIPTSASQLTNDSGYITSSALNGYATEDYVTAATNDMATKTWVGQQGYLTQHQDISGKQDVSGMTAYTTTATTNTLSGTVTAHTADTTIHVTAQDKTNWDNKSDFSGSYNDLTDKPTLFSGSYNDLTDKPTIPSKTSELTNDSNFATSAYVDTKLSISDFNTYSGTVNTAIGNKANSSDVYTKSQTSGATEIATALSGKQDTLSAGTNITISGNVISAEGGGGKAVTGGTNISVTTGTTADTINCKIPYSDVVYAKSDIILGKDMPSVSDYERVYLGKRIAARANGSFSYSIGIGVPPSTNSSDYNELYGTQSIGIGGFKIGNGSQYANFVSGCVAIGYGAKTRINDAVAIGKNTEASGTTKTNINNQLTIDTSNQVYISNSANTSTYCLQEKIETTEAALGGLKLVKLTQSAYDALSPDYDANTLYVIVN